MTDHVGITPDVAIRDVHLLAEEMGFRRLRIDRSGFGGTDQNPACWVEVGYASEEVHIRTSASQFPPYRAQYDKLDMDSIGQLLIDLVESGATEVAQ